MWNSLQQDSNQDITPYGDPFLNHSSQVFPKDLRSTFDFCLALYRQFRLYASASAKLTSFHMTSLDFPEKVDDEHKKSLSHALLKVVRLFDKLAAAGAEEAIYGNAFVWLAKPFDRYILDRRAGRFVATSLESFKPADVSYNWTDMTYTVPDRLAGTGKVTLPFFDLPSSAIERFDVIHLDPRYVRLDKPHLSDDIQVIYTPPPEMEGRIKSGKLHEVNRTPKLFLAAIAKNKDVRFDSGEVFHYKRPTPSGVSDSGWGFPTILWHFEDLYQLQVYRKTDQTIALEYMFPFRVVTPAGNKGPGGPMQVVEGSAFRHEVGRMFREQRKDRTKIHGLGVPIDLHTMGGDGKRMVLADVIQLYSDMFLESLGMPPEFYHGTLATNASPIALRMLARQYSWMADGLSNLTNFIAKGLQDVMGNVSTPVYLKAPSLAHSDEVLRMKMQMVANGEASRDEVYPDLDIPDPVNARVDRILEDQEIQRKTQERGEAFDREMRQGSMADIVFANMQNQQGAPAGGGDASQGGGLNYQASPSDDPVMIKQRATELAAQWDQMDVGTRRKEMNNCRAINENLYAMTMQALKELRAQRESAARQQNAGPGGM